jgi:hypothetical protein
MKIIPTITQCCCVVVLLAGCGPSDLCPDCVDEEPIPDLPCGGADLQTDDLNCGTCGNECWVDGKGTDYEAGSCHEGQCGPHWYYKQYLSAGGPSGEFPKASCDDVCTENSVSCVAEGCSGKTGYMCGLGDFTGECPPIDWTGPCAMDVPWPDFGGSVIPVLTCCCE